MKPRPIAIAIIVAAGGLGHSQPVKNKVEGIHLGDVKVYNSATLRNRIDRYTRQLNSLLALPTEGVLSGLFGTQGLRSRRSASALTLAGLPLPSVVESVVEVASAGKDTNTTTTTTSTTAEAKPPTTSVDLEQTLPATTLSLG